MESGMCDVIKIRRKKGRMEGKVGKETPKKEMDNPYFLVLFL